MNELVDKILESIEDGKGTPVDGNTLRAVIENLEAERKRLLVIIEKELGHEQ